MVKYRVEKIFVENFKRIKREEIVLQPITALVGGNTSGKSSVLQAAQLCVSLMQASFTEIKKGKVTRLSTLANEAVSYRPTDVLLTLRHSVPVSEAESVSETESVQTKPVQAKPVQTKSFSIGFTCTQIDDNGVETLLQLTVSVTRGKNANLALDYKGDESLIAVLGNRDQPFSIFTPGLSGIPLKEEWRTRGALDAAAMHGDANLYLRTLLDHLLRKDMTADIVTHWCKQKIDLDKLPASAPWSIFSNLLEKCYPTARIYIHHDSQKDRFIDVIVEYQGQAVSLDMASTGMLQVIQILAYACLYSPPLLLLDEPDAHLHADSQSRLYEALQGITKKTNTRIVFASHSPQLIQLALNNPHSSVVWLDRGVQVVVKPGDRPAIPLLMELGALTVGAEAFMPTNKIILLTEDQEPGPVMVFARANGARNFACLSYNGCGNLSGARHLARLLRELRPEIKVLIHRDRDFRTTAELKFEELLNTAWLEIEGITGVTEIFTPLNDIEHSFLDLNHLFDVLDGKVSKEKIQEILDVAIAVKRDDLTGRIREARGVLQRGLYDSDRMKKKVDLRAKSEMPEKAPNIKTFLPGDGTVPLSLERCHGKTVFRSFLEQLHRHLAGDSKALQAKILQESEHLQIASWQKAFQD